MIGRVFFARPDVCSKLILSTRSFSETGGRKIIKPRNKRPIIEKQRKINEDHEKIAHELGLGWRIVGATVLHRYPTITRLMEPWEVEMKNLQDKIDSKKREYMMSLIEGTDAQLVPTNDPTYEEILETMPFQPASRITEADTANDRRSVERKLDSSLFLLVKRNREENSWQFPQGKLQESEKNMRTVAERVLDRAVGKTRRWFVSNAPIGHIAYAYPKAIQEQRKQYGAKVFFYRAQLVEGAIKLETKLYKDYVWVGRDEVGEYFNKDTAEYMQALLID